METTRPTYSIFSSASTVSPTSGSFKVTLYLARVAADLLTCSVTSRAYLLCDCSLLAISPVRALVFIDLDCEFDVRATGHSGGQGFTTGCSNCIFLRDPCLSNRPHRVELVSIAQCPLHPLREWDTFEVPLHRIQRDRLHLRD